MLNLICYILAVYGISNMLVFSEGPLHIFEIYRAFMHKLPSNFGHGSECMICTPTQVGIIISAINILFINLPITPMYYLIDNASLWWIIIPMDAAIGSGATWLIHTIQEWFEGDE